MLRDTKDMGVARERDVKRDGFRTARLGIGVSAKALVPPSALILALLFFHLDLFFAFLALLGLLFGLLDFLPPVLKIQESSLIELDLCLAVSLELNREGCVTDDGLVLAALAVDNLGVVGISCFGQGCTGGGFQTTDESPFASLIVPFLLSLAVMPEINVALLASGLIQSNARNTRLEESDGERQFDLLDAVFDSLQDSSVQLAILELECCGIEGVRRDEGARGGDVVGECAVALAEARLVAGLEVFMLNGDCSSRVSIQKTVFPGSDTMQGNESSKMVEYSPAGKNKLHSAVQSKSTAVHRGADRNCNVIISSSSQSKYRLSQKDCWPLVPQMSDET